MKLQGREMLFPGRRYEVAAESLISRTGEKNFGRQERNFPTAK
jgi:hypothetical protein